jgi:hypothetical protein
MENTSIRDAIVQHLAANKRKAAQAVVERHPELFEQALVDKDTDVYAVDTVDLNAALRRGLVSVAGDGRESHNPPALELLRRTTQSQRRL